MNRLKTIVPLVSKNQLLVIASVVWTFAGVMLLIRGMFGLIQYNNLLMIKLFGSVFAGLIFFKFIFVNVSSKHINRILNLKEEKIPFYAFFNKRSYAMMPLMIGMGVGLRVSGIIPFQYLAIFYIVMGTPLLLSAIRFIVAAKKGTVKN